MKEKCPLRLVSIEVQKDFFLSHNVHVEKHPDPCVGCKVHPECPEHKE